MGERHCSCPVNTFMVQHQQETSKNETDELSNHSCHSGKQYNLKPACVLNSFVFLQNLVRLEIPKSKQVKQTLSFKVDTGREYPGLPATQTQALRLGQQRIPYITSANQRLTQLSTKLTVPANTSLWFLHYMPRLVPVYLTLNTK